jgi:hypothetical protein
MVFVAEINRCQPDFYTRMGVFFGSRQVASEVGIHLYDDADKRWFGAFDGDSLIGFASVRKCLVSDCYVIPSRRNQGVFALILQSVQIFEPGYLKANCTHSSKKAFFNSGFVPVRATKNFTFMEFRNA